MRKRKIFRLSRIFLDGYKSFLKKEIDTRELKKRTRIPDDVIFLQEECDPSCNVVKEFKFMLRNKMDSLIETILSEMENKEIESRRVILQKVLIVFLRTYSCYAKGEKQTKAEEALTHFMNSLGDVPSSEKMNHEILEIMDIFISSRDLMENIEPLIRPVIFKLISIYSGLGISDSKGVRKCKELGKIISINWHKSTPEVVTLNILNQREKNSKFPPDECELLRKYSFGSLNEKNGAVNLRLHFLNYEIGDKKVLEKLTFFGVYN